MSDNTFQRPFTASFEGWTPDPDDLTLWPNTVTVETVEDCATTVTGTLAAGEDVYADRGNCRHLVEVDTNYKPGRTGQHPVRLTRVDALQFAEAVLNAVTDTFNAHRAGTLRPAEARGLLPFVREVAAALERLREQATADLGTDPLTDPISEEC